MPQPLTGVRIVDFTHVMAGPFATHLLGSLGADIVKIESPRGDIFRAYAGDKRGIGMAPPFIGANAGKKSLAIDLKSSEAKTVIAKLVAQADVVVENFRPGVIDRLGFGFEACKKIKEDVIFCSVSGYGQDGPMRDYAAVDNVVQATSGMMTVSGLEGDEPQRVGVPAVDTYTATCAALAIVSAILQRDRFGQGQKIDVAMMDCSLVLLYGAVMPYLVNGALAAKTGNTGFSAQPTAAIYTGADGRLLSLGAIQQSQFETVCAVLERDDLITDDRFKSPSDRQRNAPDLIAILEQEFARRPSDEWERLLNQRGAPCGVVRTVGDALELDQVKGRGLRVEMPAPNLPRGETLGVLNAPFLFAQDGPHIDTPPPLLGQHSREVLAGLGYGEAEIVRLIEQGVVMAAHGAGGERGAR